MQQLATRTKTLRKREGVSQAKLAQRVGLDPKTVERVENARVKPSMKTISLLAEALNVEVWELFEPTDYSWIEERLKGLPPEDKWRFLETIYEALGEPMPTLPGREVEAKRGPGRRRRKS